jgi:hypothetical protein
MGRNRGKPQSFPRLDYETRSRGTPGTAVRHIRKTVNAAVHLWRKRGGRAPLSRLHFNLHFNLDLQSQHCLPSSLMAGLYVR